MQTRSYIFAWKNFKVSYPSNETLDSKIRKASVLVYRIIPSHSINTSTLQMKYDILDIMTIVKTVQKRLNINQMKGLYPIPR